MAIREDLQPGHRLREADLAAKLGVSRTPVRSALGRLQESGFVVQVKNRGFSIARSPSEFESLLLEVPQTTEEAAYQRIAADWFNGDLPVVLTESDLRRWYGVGRETLSRIIERLVHDGVIVRASGKGYKLLSTIAEPEVFQESSYYRQTIELAALSSPTFKVEKKLIDACRGRHYELLYADINNLETIQILQVDGEFHELIGTLSGNRYLLQSIQAQNRLRLASQYGRRHQRQQIVRSFTEQLTLMDCIEEGDIELAAVLLRRHLNPTNNIWTPATALHESGPERRA